MTRRLRTAVALAGAVALTATACSDSEPPPTLVSYAPEDADADLRIDREGGGGECSFDSRSQLAMVDPETGDVQWEMDVPWNAFGHFVVADSTLLAIGDDPDGTVESVYAVNLATGRPMWQRVADVTGATELVVADDAVVYRDGTSLVVVEVEDGTARWERPAPDEDATITVVEDDVIVVSPDGTVDRLAGATGDVVWSVAGDGRGGPVGPIIDEERGLVVASAAEGSLRALDLASGDARWEHASGGRYWRDLQTVGDALVVDHARRSSDRGSTDFVSFDVETGDELWRTQFSGFDGSLSVLDDVAVYGGGRRIVYDTVTADELWETEDVVRSVSRPSEDLLLLEVESPRGPNGPIPPDPTLRGVGPRTGDVAWRTVIPGWIDEYNGPPVMVDDRLLVGMTRTNSVTDDDDAGLILALDPTDGSEIWRLERRDGVTASPVEVDGGVAVLSSDPPFGCD